MSLERAAPRFLERLASRLILFDKRGTGLSDRPRTLTLETQMDDIRAVLDAVGSERAVLLGAVPPYSARASSTPRLQAAGTRPDIATRRASCSCGQLTAEVEGDPVRVSICHCLACQRRTGSAFGMQARWPRKQVRIEGNATEYVRISDEGEERSFFFCSRCGATVYYWSDPERIAVPVGAFADPNFPAPRVSVWEERMHPWVGLSDGIEHIG